MKPGSDAGLFYVLWLPVGSASGGKLSLLSSILLLFPAERGQSETPL